MNDSNLLNINYPGRNTKRNFAVCVPPVYLYDDAIRFLEWVEFHRALGVERFIFYNISVGPQGSCLMEEYGSLDNMMMEVRPWGDLPSENIRMGETLRNQNQLAALYDCVFREMGKSRYVLYTDLDEFVVPHEKGIGSYLELIQRLDEMAKAQGIGSVGSYQFQNAFFPPSANLQENDSSEVVYANNIEDEKDLVDKISSQLVTLNSSVRQENPHPQDFR
jgi:hypothetical protein